MAAGTLVNPYSNPWETKTVIGKYILNRPLDRITRIARQMYSLVPVRISGKFYPFLHPIARYLDNTIVIARSGSIYEDPRWPYFNDVFAAVAEKNIEGDYLEFGVFYGKTTLMAMVLAEKFDIAELRIFGFDSFSGFPYNEGPFTEKRVSSSVGLFRRYIRSRGMNPDNVTLTEGVYSDSLTSEVKEYHRISRAAIVHVDCDQYLSTRDVLSFIEDLVNPGSVIIFDDWDSFDEFAGHDQAHNYGEQKAFAEWGLRDRFQDLYHSGERKAFIMT